MLYSVYSILMVDRAEKWRQSYALTITMSDAFRYFDLYHIPYVPASEHLSLYIFVKKPITTKLYRHFRFGFISG